MQLRNEVSSHDPTEPATLHVHVRSRVGHGAERHEEIGYGHVSNVTIGDGSHVRLCQHDEDCHEVSVQRQEEHQAVHQGRVVPSPIKLTQG